MKVLKADKGKVYVAKDREPYRFGKNLVITSNDSSENYEQISKEDFQALMDKWEEINK